MPKIAIQFDGLHLLFPWGHTFELVERYTADVIPRLEG